MPYDYIITLDEGQLGLPDKYFYGPDADEEVVRGYKLLLRDFAINMGKRMRLDLPICQSAVQFIHVFLPLTGMVSREADLFADDIFYYERRIVNHIEAAKGSGERQQNKLLRLAELKSIAPSVRQPRRQRELPLTVISQLL